MSLPHIGISHSHTVPREMLADFIDTVKTERLDLRVEAREQDRPYAGLEWLLPTAGVIFIAKAYFDAFLKEMGKDHYHLLKAGLSTLRSKLLGSSAPEVVVVSTQGKLRAGDSYSLLYSIVADGEGRLRFKLLLPSQCSEAEYEEAIDAFLAFLRDFHSQSLTPQMAEELKRGGVVGGMMLVAFNRETKALQIVDPLPRKLRADT